MDKKYGRASLIAAAAIAALALAFAGTARFAWGPRSGAKEFSFSTPPLIETRAGGLFTFALSGDLLYYDARSQRTFIRAAANRAIHGRPCSVVLLEVLFFSE